MISTPPPCFQLSSSPQTSSPPAKKKKKIILDFYSYLLFPGLWCPDVAVGKLSVALGEGRRKQWLWTERKHSPQMGCHPLTSHTLINQGGKVTEWAVDKCPSQHFSLGLKVFDFGVSIHIYHVLTSHLELQLFPFLSLPVFSFSLHFIPTPSLSS